MDHEITDIDAHHRRVRARIRLKREERELKRMAREDRRLGDHLFNTPWGYCIAEVHAAIFLWE